MVKSSTPRGRLPAGGAYSASVIAASTRCHECLAEFSGREPSVIGVRRRIVFSLSASARNATWRASRSSDTAKHLLQLVRRGDFKLVVAAVFRLLVGAPAQEDCGVPEAVALHVAGLDLAHARGSKRVPPTLL